MKQCFKCGAIKELGDFYRHPAMSDGRLGKCKECTKKDTSDNYRKNRDRYVEYEKSRAMLPHRVKARNAYAKTKRGKKAIKRGQLAYKARYHFKYVAHYTTRNAIRDGLLTMKPCEVCQATENIHAHHDDYSKPLVIRWLCKNHHVAWHKHNKAIYPF